MNAIRQIVTPDASGNISLQVPVELRQRPVEVIVLAVGETDDSGLSVLTGPDAVSNAWKVIRRTQLDVALQQSIAILQQQAAQNGLTPELLDELLGAALDRRMFTYTFNSDVKARIGTSPTNHEDGKLTL